MRIWFKPPARADLKARFAVDMHVHSKHSHDCGTPVHEIIARARELGIRVALTDHNSIGGVLEGVKLAPDVIMPAIEITASNGRDVIPYFYEVEELERFHRTFLKPKMKVKSSLRSTSTPIAFETLLEELSRWRCVVVLPHPFAMGPRRSYLTIRKQPKLLVHVHALEVVNQALLHRQNLAALGWSIELAMPGTGGTDSHVLKTVGKALTISHATTWAEFLDDIKKGKTVVFADERRLPVQVAQTATSATRILREKARVLSNRRIRNGG